MFSVRRVKQLPRAQQQESAEEHYHEVVERNYVEYEQQYADDAERLHKRVECHDIIGAPGE